jgi:hypothetical protein
VAELAPASIKANAIPIQKNFDRISATELYQYSNLVSFDVQLLGLANFLLHSPHDNDPQLKIGDREIDDYWMSLWMIEMDHGYALWKLRNGRFVGREDECRC